MIIEPEVSDKPLSSSASMFEKLNTKMQSTVSSGMNHKLSIVTREFLKKYISFAKAQRMPDLHKDCIDYAAQFYAALRKKVLNYPD